MKSKTWILAGALLLAGGALQAQVPTGKVTIASDPKGRTFTVDFGSTKYTAPADFNWPVGSLHYVRWDNPQASGGITYTFTGWADGPADNPRSLVIFGDTIVTGKFSSSGVGVGSGVRFVPISPCRAVDTRADQGFTGPFGPPTLTGGQTRNFPLNQGGRCSIPATAQAYSLNVTVVPRAPALGYLSLWPAGQTQPTVSTLNSQDGSIVANAAIVPSGDNGQISVFATDATDVIIDINGYFDSAVGVASYSLYTLTPCRVVDTRNFASLNGGPALFGGQFRDFPLTLGGCGIPGGAVAYSLNATVVPSQPLGFLTLWPTGTTIPPASTLNSPRGRVVANAALVPAGINGNVMAYVTDPTHLILDVNGYFAAPGQVNQLVYYPLSPCRVVDTRNTAGTYGGPIMAGGTIRTIPVRQSNCGTIPDTVRAYSLNVTVVPNGVPLGYLSIFPANSGLPNVSTLNSLDGRIVANAAIVPSDAAGAIGIFVTDTTHVIVDINGYFAPPQQQ